MTGKEEQKSRKEKRKEARSEKHKLRFLSWVQHQGGKNKKTTVVSMEPSPAEEVKPKKEPKKRRREPEDSHKPKSKFQEYLEMEMGGAAVGREEDLEMEKKLAKKLRVKKGKLGGPDDGMDDLFADLGFCGDYGSDGETKDTKPEKKKRSRKNKNVKDDAMEEGSGKVVDDNKVDKKKKKRKNKKVKDDASEEPGGGGVEMAEESDVSVHESEDEEPNVVETPPVSKAKYVPPSLRAISSSESEEISLLRRRVRGLLNRLSESNVESITQEVAAIFRSVPRGVGCQLIGDEVLASCSRGPRGNEQYAAVFAAFIAGMTCLVGMDFSAKILSSLAKSFEDEHSKDDGLSVRNLMLLFSYLCIFDVIAWSVVSLEPIACSFLYKHVRVSSDDFVYCCSDLVYDLLSVLSERLTELDVSTVLTILQCCGMKLRGDDPGAMKDFVLSIQNSVRQSKLRSAGREDGKADLHSKRMEFMLETICDIKNNKKRSKEDPSQHTRVKKWLQKLKSEDILLRGLKWSKLLDPEKKGQWWLSGDVSSTAGNVEDVAAVISKEVVEAQKLVQLAAAQRMNTDIRRAIFCIIMSAEDYVDAFDKILRLDLSGKQDREIMRVIVDCCLQEKTFNKYYTVLASKLCSHDKNHKFSLQYCIWDRFKELDEMELSRSMNLAKLVAEMLANFSLSLATLKVVNLANPVEMTPKKTMHFRMMFETLMQKEDSLMWNVFTRIAGNPELELLRDGIVMFVRQHVIAKDAGKELAGKFKIAKKALDNSAGVLM
ncbi:nucleolar MIF4G domain-containing protein 1 isoform X1 [Triticum aestivum]|uniref:nucleolar MIF4G domain-containing protein 1 isoform X1 n=1 Tax=Triticum aestivum TaxID=4565 RepID=UPI001D00F8BD|nr:nucleolar MIF4G domain-containing protein 1-like isoform X1 [Triticum aestivum]